jgi:hypothetical protein
MFKFGSAIPTVNIGRRRLRLMAGSGDFDRRYTELITKIRKRNGASAKAKAERKRKRRPQILAGTFLRQMHKFFRLRVFVFG